MHASDSGVLVLTDESFPAQVDQAAGLVMVDFGAAWCAPCRLVVPIVARLAGDYAGRATVATMDVDANPRTAARFGVRNLPTFLFFRDGVLVDRVVGAVPGAALEGKIQEHL